MKKMIMIVAAIAISAVAVAQDLTINGAEFGIGKFHRRDNKEHKYEDTNAWKAFILPEGVSTKTAYVQKNAENNYTIFYTNLEEFMIKAVEVAKKTGKKVSMLNINAHGLPGGMWFPKDEKTRDSFECMSWRSAANNSDDANYNQYYSTVSKDEILSFNAMAERPRIPSYSCLTGLPEWQEIAAKVPAFTSIFSDNAQVHMLSCIVGLGTLGDNYTQGLAKLLFKSGTQQVQTSIKFGLGDWSMPEGMGFWGYESDEQIAHDNDVYPVNRRDKDIMQMGSIRVAQLVENKVKSGMIKDQEFMVLEQDTRVVDFSGHKTLKSAANAPLPATIRIPGTNVTINLK